MKTNILIALGIIAAMVVAYLLHNVFPARSPMDEYLEEVEEAILAEGGPRLEQSLRR